MIRKSDLSRAYMLDVWPTGVVTLRKKSHAIPLEEMGGLPVYSTDTEEEAQELRTLLCKLANDGSGARILNRAPERVEDLEWIGEEFRAAHEGMMARVFRAATAATSQPATQLIRDNSPLERFDARYMCGALQSGNERGHSKVHWHAILASDSCSNGALPMAACGRRPAIMWSAAKPDQPITCPACLRRISCKDVTSTLKRVILPSRIRRGRLATQPVWRAEHSGRVLEFQRKLDAARYEREGCSDHARYLCACRGREVTGDDDVDPA